jgi:tRNA(Ile)-lysidine synthase
MATLDPAVAALRTAVRRTVPAGLGPSASRPPSGSVVLVACSGGPDSMALAAAAGFVLPRQGMRVGLVTVDHQLQPGSAARAARLAAWAQETGFAPVTVETVAVDKHNDGPEAAARAARYRALATAAQRHDAAAVLLGHTRDDQAETVLLALVRGAGAKGLAAMPIRRRMHGVLFLRPLLDVSRATTHAACAAQQLDVWHDPHNSDPSYRRTHARALLAQLTDQLGPAVVTNLGRTASLAAADAAYLDAVARRAAARAAPPQGAGLSVAVLATLPDAVRTRVLHRWARGLGVPGSALSARHVTALDALVTDWHGQGAVSLPGGTCVIRREGLLITATDTAGLPHD